ncbi:MAG: DNA polymerase III subunit delta' [Desulfobacteraceae bacterium 4572_35.1]|nr:MAG: DNA polymerase III subunit delta' [Desulfobacteraceae bacterium 4572_35.1]
MNFAHILGHDHQKEQLKQAWKSRRLAHAYLFTGADGIGKKLMAVALSKLIFCDQHSGCGTCTACRRLEHNNHPDFYLLEPDGTQIKIDQVRHVQQELSHPPISAPLRVCIIDNAERLNAAASNALLKTLEEPRPNTLIILISAHYEQLLDTIKSRCQQLPFARLKQQTVADIITAHNHSDDNTECNSLQKNSNQANIIAALAAGSLKKALSSNQEFFFEQRYNTLNAINTLNPNSVVPMLELAEKLANDKDRLEDLIWILLSYYRDIFLIINRASPTLLTNIDMLQQVQHQAANETPISIQHKLSAIIECQFQITRNVNPQLAIEVLLIRLTKQLQETVSLTNRKTQIKTF